MTTPTDGVEGTQGKLFYWTRQGISLADFQKKVDDAIALIEAAGGIVGLTQLGIDLVTSDTQAQARAVIDAASTTQAAAGGGGGSGGGTAINLPIAISDVSNLQTTLNGKAATSHFHVASDISGLSAPVQGILAAGNHAQLVAALALVASDITNVTDVGVNALTATGVDLTARQTAFRLAIDAAKTVHTHSAADISGSTTVSTPFFGDLASYWGTDLTVARPAELANRPILWFIDGTALPTAYDETKGDRWMTVGGP